MTDAQLKASLRQRMEKAILRLTVKELGKIGWKPVQVWDSEEYVPATTIEEVIDAAMAVDECTVHFENAAGRDHGVFFVWGNGCGDEAISNHHVGAEDFSDCMDRISAIVESADILFVEAKAEGA